MTDIPFELQALGFDKKAYHTTPQGGALYTRICSQTDGMYCIVVARVPPDEEGCFSVDGMPQWYVRKFILDAVVENDREDVYAVVASNENLVHREGVCGRVLALIAEEEISK